MFVILNPSPFVTLSEAKGLVLGLRINSVKNLTPKCHPERSEGSPEFLRYAQDRLRLTPQNDIVTQSPQGRGRG
jgi:hypothetical protein